MDHLPTALLPIYPSLGGAQCASGTHANICNGPSSALSETVSASSGPYMNPPNATSVSPIQMFLKCTLAAFCYSIRVLSLYRIWHSVYHLTWDENNLNLENALTSPRSRWSETLQKMKRVWTLIIMVSSLIITLSVAFLQIDQIVNNFYIRTFAILACVLSSASLAASCIFIANGENLDCVEKFRRWEIASQNPNAMPSVDFWTCLALPLTSLAWSAGFFLMTLFSLMWIDQGAHTTLTHISKFYRIRKFLEN